MQEKVKDLMSQDIVSVSPEENISKAAQLMELHDIGSIPVIKKRELKGLLTDRDIVIRVIAKDKDPQKTKVEEIMTKEVAFVTPEQSIHEVVNKMAEEKVRRLPVIFEGFVSGIISLADIARSHAGPEIASAISEISKNEPHLGEPQKQIEENMEFNNSIPETITGKEYDSDIWNKS